MNKPTRAQREMTWWAVGRAPTIDELAFELDIDPGRVAELQRIAQDTVSLETPVGEDEDGTLGASSSRISSQIARRRRHLLLLAGPARHGSRRSERAGARGPDHAVRSRRRADAHLEEVGSHFKVTRERIRTAQTKALAKLRHPDKSQTGRGPGELLMDWGAGNGRCRGTIG